MTKDKVIKLIELFASSKSSDELNKISAQMSVIIAHPEYGDRFLKLLSSNAERIKEKGVDASTLFDAKTVSGSGLLDQILSRSVDLNQSLSFPSQLLLRDAAGKDWLKKSVSHNNPLRILCGASCEHEGGDLALSALQKDKGVTLCDLIHSDILRYGNRLFGASKTRNIIGECIKDIDITSTLSAYEELNLSQALSFNDVSIADIAERAQSDPYGASNITATLLASVEAVGIYKALDVVQNREETLLLLKLYNLSPIECLPHISNPQAHALILQSYS